VIVILDSNILSLLEQESNLRDQGDYSLSRRLDRVSGESEAIFRTFLDSTTILGMLSVKVSAYNRRI
jgi:hypothetical protein